jgi:predicted DsbA family dithiol-disulfide isomerase
MSDVVRIDMVSDVACPWCAIGITTLESALQTLQGTIAVEVHLQPFELNPDMEPGGEDVISYLSGKYGIEPEQVLANQQRIYSRGKEVGFEFHPEGRKRVYNTFNCHRLIHWASQECGLEQAFALKKSLFAAYFTFAENMDQIQTLLDAVERAGLDTDRAAQVLNSDEFAQAVRAAQTRWKMLGVQSVPAFILNNQFLVSGAQPQEHLIAAIRQAHQRAQQQ